MNVPRRFAIHDLRNLGVVRKRHSRDWDYRFVMAVLLLYGCVGLAFFAVDWIHASPDGEPPSVQEMRDWRSGPPGLHSIGRPRAPEPVAAAEVR